MKIFAIDACTADGSVALLENGTVIASAFVSGARTHGETLLPMAMSVLNSTSCTFDNIDAFACTVGPGSFTGIRVAVSMIKGMAFGKKKPCIGVSVLEALASSLFGLRGMIVPVCDARRGNYYNAIFKSDGSVLTRECDDRLTDSELLAREIVVNSVSAGLDVYFVGDGAQRMNEYSKMLFSEREVSRLKDTPELLNHVYAAETARVAQLKYMNMSTEQLALCTDERLAALYLRPTLAERELEAKRANK